MSPSNLDRSDDTAIHSVDRLQVLQRTKLLDTPAEETFDRLTRLISRILDVPVVLVSLVDDHRQFFKSAYGLPEPWASRRETPLSHSFCQHIVSTGQPLIIADARSDPRVRDNPAVHDLGVIAYAGMPIVTGNGQVLGSFCAIDQQPRVWSERELVILHDLTALAIAEIELRREMAERHALEVQLRTSRQQLKDFAHAANDWLWETDAAHRFIWFSPNVETLAGVAPEWHYGKTRMEIGMTDINAEAWRAHIAALEAHQPFRDFELCRRGPDGVYWIRSNGVPVFDDQGRFQGYRGTGTDITESKRIELALAEREEQLRLITDALPVLIGYADSEQRVRFVNAAFEQWFALPRQAMLGMHLRELLGAINYDPIAAHIDAVLSGQPASFDRERLYADGRVRHIQSSYIPHFGADGRVLGFYALVMDITASKRLEAALFHEKELAQVTLKSIGDAVITTDPHGRVEYFNPVAEKLTGWSCDVARGRPLDEVFHIVNEDSRQPVPNPVDYCLAGNRVAGLSSDTVLISRNGSEYAIQDSAAPIRDRNGEILGVVLVFSDVSEQHRLAREISHQATHDALTGLVNRREFERRLQRVLATVAHEAGEHALCYLDLDRFKIVNDSCGHAAGDELLRQLAGLFQSKVRHRDTLARLGGDEFAVLLEHCPPAQIRRVADNLLQAVNKFRFLWNGRRFRLGVSIGLVPITPGSETSLERVLQAADKACYIAKDAGRNRIHVHHGHAGEPARHNHEMLWITRLQQALNDNRFRLYAQPIRSLTSTQKQGGLHCELLLRLRDDPQRITLPGTFMPAAERYHLTVHIDRWVITQAFHYLVKHPRFLDQLALGTINLSAHSLADSQFQDFVLRQFRQTGRPAGKICFEITETAAFANFNQTIRFIEELRIHGCRFALDDFGSGLASFGYLKNLPVDFLKIDGVFIKDMLSDPIDLALVRFINETAQLMSKQTIAEYVDSEAILQKVRQIGVHYAQGYHVGRPRPLEELRLSLQSSHG